MGTLGRPRQFDRDQALEIAMKLFRLHGYDGTPISLLGEKMGINPPSLYAAFGSKESLYREALDLYAAKYSAPLIFRLRDEPCVQTAIYTFLKKCAELFVGERDDERGCMIASGDLVYAPGEQDRADDMTLKRSMVEDAIRSRLARAKAEKMLPASLNVKALAGFFAVVIQGLSIRARDGASRTEMLRIIDVAMQALPQDDSGLKTAAAAEHLAA